MTPVVIFYSLFYISVNAWLKKYSIYQEICTRILRWHRGIRIIANEATITNLGQ